MSKILHYKFYLFYNFIFIFNFLKHNYCFNFLESSFLSSETAIKIQPSDDAITKFVFSIFRHGARSPGYKTNSDKRIDFLGYEWNIGEKELLLLFEKRLSMLVSDLIYKNPTFTQSENEYAYEYSVYAELMGID